MLRKAEKRKREGHKETEFHVGDRKFSLDSIERRAKRAKNQYVQIIDSKCVRKILSCQLKSAKLCQRQRM